MRRQRWRERIVRAVLVASYLVILLVAFSLANAAIPVRAASTTVNLDQWASKDRGASMVSGSPWHMRTLQLDGSGNKNQDRSISPSAIVGELPPFAFAPPTPAPTRPPAGAPSTPAPATRQASGSGIGPGPLFTAPPTAADEPAATDTEELAAVLAGFFLGVWLVGLIVAFLRARSRISAP